jgi:hypothetical protein
MKKLTTIKVVFAALILCAAACKKNDNANPEPINSAATAQQFTALFGAQTQKLEINPSIENSFTLKGGTKITISANSFSWGASNSTAKVIIEAMEVLKRSDVLFSGTNTNHISGSPLASDGFIYLNASSNGVNADKALLKPIKISIPTTRAGFTQIWEGVEKIDTAKQMAWQAPAIRPNGVGQNKEIIAKDAGFAFDMGNLGWINCDVFYSYANPKTTTRVQLINNPGSLASFRGFSGETFVFFCAKGSNVAAQMYTPDGANKVKSYDNVMPIGAQGKYLSFAIKNSKYYYAELETTIIANQNITLTLVETTEAQIQLAINSLNTY